MTDSIPTLLQSICAELATTAQTIPAPPLHSLTTAIATAKTTHVYGVGREKLALHAFAMRLHHLNLPVSLVGSPTAAPILPGDLLLVSAGPGSFRTVKALVGVALRAGADTACVTAVGGGEVPAMCRVVVEIGARTMADGGEVPGGEEEVGGVGDVSSASSAELASVLPMGSAYEGALFILFEALVFLLRRKLNVSEAEMRSRHTNLE